MRTIGLDLAVAGAHKAVVLDDTSNRFVTPVLTISPRPGDLDLLLQHARAGAEAEPLRVVMEPTGLAWFPVAVYMARHDVPVYLVKSQQVSDLRKVYSKYAKSDRIDARVLARLPLVNPEGVHALTLTTPDTLACQRGCRELDRLMQAITASRNRLQAIDRAAWLGLLAAVFPDQQSAALCWVREQWYNPSSRPERKRSVTSGVPVAVMPRIAVSGRLLWSAWPRTCSLSTARTVGIWTSAGCTRKCVVSKISSRRWKHGTTTCG